MTLRQSSLGLCSHFCIMDVPRCLAMFAKILNDNLSTNALANGLQSKIHFPYQSLNGEEPLLITKVAPNCINHHLSR